MFQKELLEILAAFEITAKVDYLRLTPERRSVFLARLFRAFAKESQELVKEYRDLCGVKLRFNTAPQLNSPHSNVPTDTFLKKAAFYANRVCVTFPFKKVTSAMQLQELAERPQHDMPAKRSAKRRIIHWGPVPTLKSFAYGSTLQHSTGTYAIDPRVLNDLISLIINLRPSIEAGVTQVFPVFPETEKTFKKKSLGLIDANFQADELRRQFSESAQVTGNSGRTSPGLTSLLLPHFSDVPWERILEIREKEQEMYFEFQKRLENLLIGAAETDSESIILSYMREMDIGVRELHKKFKDISVSYKRKNIQLMVKTLSTGLIMMLPIDPGAQASVVSILGGVSLMDYMSVREDRLRELREMKNNAFYMPWLIFKASTE